MDWRQQQPRVSFGGFGGGGPTPRDLWILLAVVFGTFSLRFFSGTAWLPEILALTPAVYSLAFLWQLVTYPFIGIGGPGLWFLLELLILFWFGRDVFRALGQKRFWRLVVTTSFVAALAAVVVQLALVALNPGSLAIPFQLMQGQRMLMVIFIAAFAVLYRHATILLFFVLPIQARWFLWLEILFAFMGFLGTRDLPGFVGICAAVGWTYISLIPGGLNQVLKSWRLRWAQWRNQAELDRLRKKRGFKVVRGDQGRQGPWVH
jgi:hypothetical protein